MRFENRGLLPSRDTSLAGASKYMRGHWGAVVRLVGVAERASQVRSQPDEKQDRLSSEVRARMTALIHGLAESARSGSPAADRSVDYGADLRSIRESLSGSDMLNDLMRSRREDAAREDLG